MKTQCSIIASALGSLTESPLHVLQGNQTGTIEFWRVSARAQSATPALCKFSCSQPSGDDLTDVMNYLNYVLSHSWGLTIGSNVYQQTDTLDASTLEPTSSTIDTETPPDSFTGGLGPFNWNTQLGYRYPNGPGGGIDSSTSTSGADWDKAPTRAAIITALDSVDWTALWANDMSSPNNWQFDRANISPSDEIAPPFPTGHTGLPVSGHASIGPNRVLSGTVGAFLEGFSISEALGVSLERAQIQVRNFHGPPIPYFIYELAGVAAGVALGLGGGSTTRNAVGLTDTHTVYRKLSEGTWTADRQIIQLPDAAMDGPQTVSTTFGARVRNGTAIGMVVGMTFEDWMLANLGPTWADYLF